MRPSVMNASSLSSGPDSSTRTLLWLMSTMRPRNRSARVTSSGRRSAGSPWSFNGGRLARIRPLNITIKGLKGLPTEALDQKRDKARGLQIADFVLRRVKIRRQFGQLPCKLLSVRLRHWSDTLLVKCIVPVDQFAPKSRPKQIRQRGFRAAGNFVGQNPAL